MNETYVEVLIKKKTPVYMTLLKFVTIMLTVCFALVGFTIWPAWIIAVIIGIAAYFIYMNADIEYEYLYVDKELTVDKIMNKSSRKRIASFDMSKMEIMAPIKSYHLDSYKNRTDKTTDYSCGVEMQPDKRYVFYYDGTQRVIFEPDEEMMKAIQMGAPRKVFKD